MCALGPSVFVAPTSIFAKGGRENANSNLAAGTRTVVVAFARGVVFLTGEPHFPQKWLFLVLSGLFTGAVDRAACR